MEYRGIRMREVKPAVPSTSSLSSSPFHHSPRLTSHPYYSRNNNRVVQYVIRSPVTQPQPMCVPVTSYRIDSRTGTICSVSKSRALTHNGHFEPLPVEVLRDDLEEEMDEQICIEEGESIDNRHLQAGEEGESLHEDDGLTIVDESDTVTVTADGDGHGPVPPVASSDEMATPPYKQLDQMRAKEKEFPLTYVERSRRWTHKSEAQMATTDEDGVLYYNPDPYRPAPPTKGAPSTLVRMHFAAQRIDNRKYRAQKSVARATSQMESASCDKCNLRFFLPYNHFRSHVSYAVSMNRYSMPVTFFCCPLCKKESQIYM